MGYKPAVMRVVIVFNCLTGHLGETGDADACDMLLREIDDLTADISKKRSMIQNRTRQIRLIINKEQRNGKQRKATKGTI